VQIQKDLSKAASSARVSSAGIKTLDKIAISGRIQAQYAGIGTDIDGTSADPAATNHFFLRRVYFGIKATLASDWTANIVYDFAGTSFDAAFVQWKKSDELNVDIGLRKAPIGIEEWFTSSGSIRAIERSPATRYFVEPNNGRRLAAGGYRTGVYMNGRKGDFFYTVAVTNPERPESAADSTSTGTAGTNKFSYWGNVGYKAPVAGGSATFSLSAGLLPDQGGKTLGTGDDLAVYNAWVDFTKGRFNLQLEYFVSDNDHGASATRDSRGRAFMVQPSYKAGSFEYVLRYSHVDSDGRGVNLSDGIRSAPSGGTMDTMSEWFGGVNYYIRGNDVKLQLGVMHGEANDTVFGAPAKATTQGVRSQMQVNF
jgi:hypothetical protein